MRIRAFRTILAGVAALIWALLSGCQTQTLYQWEGYQPQVYAYFKGNGEGPGAQIAALEEGLEKVKAKGGLIPPGYHAHLGMLYGQVGKEDLMIQHLGEEKSLFPESGTYVDFLLRKYKK